MSKKHDLSGIDAMFGSKPEASPAPVHKSTSGQVRKRTSPRKEKSEEESAGLVRYTLYFPPEVLELLEETWYQLRKESHKVPRWKIASLILEEGLRDTDHVKRLINRDKGQ